MPLGVLKGDTPGIGVPLGPENDQHSTGIGHPHPDIIFTEPDESETITVYAIAKDVENFLAETQYMDALSEIGEQTIESYIVNAEGEYDERTASPMRPTLITDEVHDLDSYVSRRPDFFPDFQPRPIHLNHRPMLPFDPNRGHKIEVFFGGDTTQGSDPIKRWTLIGTEGYGRSNRYWFDEKQGVLYLRIFPFFRFANLFRITYEAGRRFESMDAPLYENDKTITLPTTWNYATRGLVRIGKEYIFYTGKNDTQLTGCQRAQFNTNKVFHPAGSMVYQVNDSLRSLVAKKAAAEVLENEVFVSIVANGGRVSPEFVQKAAGWKQEWNEYIGSTKQSWGLI